MTDKITIHANRTRFASADLVKLVRMALRAVGRGKTTHNVTIDIGYTRKEASWAGRVWSDAGTFKVRSRRIRKQDLHVRFSLRNEDHDEFALRALAGQLLNQLSTAWNKVPTVPDWQRDTSWAAGMILTRKVEETRTASERAEAREAKARKMLARAEADRDRAQARVDAWAKKVRYYDRKEAGK